MSNLLKTTSVRKIETLLNLFSVKTLRETWNDVKGDKLGLCLEIAGNRDVLKFSNFIQDNLSLCKQHIYAFDSNIDVESLRELNIFGLEIIGQKIRADYYDITYLSEIKIEVIVTEPIQKQAVEYIIPLKIELHSDKVLVRFVKFEKNIQISGIDRNKLIVRKDNHEEDILKEIKRAFIDAGFQFTTADLHKGIKHLWHSDFIDSSTANYKTDKSTDTKRMDDNRGIKKYNNEAYEEHIRHAKLHNCLFATVVKEGEKPIVFSADSGKGIISFNTYSETAEDSDNVVKEILKHNK